MLKYIKNIENCLKPYGYSPFYQKFRFLVLLMCSESGKTITVQNKNDILDMKLCRKLFFQILFTRCKQSY